MPKISAKPAAAVKGKGPRPVPAPDPAIVRKIFERFRAADPAPRSELEYVDPVHPARRRRPLRPGDRCRGQQGDAGAVCRRRHAGRKCWRFGEARLRDMVKTIGLYRNKAKNIIALSAKLVEETRRRGAALAGKFSKPCRKWGARPPMSCSTPPSASRVIAVDTHVFRVANRIPLARGKTPSRGRARARKDRGGAIQAPRPSLARSARALRLQGASARMRALHHRGSVPLAGEEGVSGARRAV